jgi:hypothetical protein
LHCVGIIRHRRHPVNETEFETRLALTSDSTTRTMDAVSGRVKLRAPMNDQARSASLPAEVAVAARHARRLRGRTVTVPDLDEATRRTAFALFARAYEGAEWARFLSDLEEKQHVILMRDGETGELKGFSTVSVRSERTDRGRAIVVFSGDTVIDRDYWGQKVLHRQLSLLFMKLQLQNPLRPVYWFVVSKGYKTYLGLINNFPISIPRHERPDDPRLRRLLDRLAMARFGATYDVSAGIAVNVAHERVRAGLAPIDDAAKTNPRVRYFIERNPGHARGDELACLGLVRKRDAAWIALRTAMARLRKRTPRI